MIVEQTQVSSAEVQSRTPFEILSQTLLFKNEDHRLYWQKAGSKLATYLRLAKYSCESQYSQLLMFYSVYAPNLGPWPNATRDNVSWTCCIGPRGENLELSMNFQKGSKCTVRMSAETMSPQSGTKEDPLNTKAEKQLIESLNALEPTLNTTWFNHFNQEIVVPEESALSRQDILDRIPFKSQRVHGVDLIDSGFVLKSYFLPAIRSEITGIEPQKIIFDGIRRLGSKNENFNCAVDILEKWMIPANGRLMEYWDTVSYDALDAEKARIKVYTGFFVDSLKQVYDIFTLGGLLEGDDIDKGIEFVKILWRDLVDLEPSSSQLKHCMQWVWEIRSDVRYPVPKLYFSAGEIEDHYVSDAVAKILQHIGWHEHVVTHKALMDEAWSVQVLFMCCISMAQDTPANE